MSQPTVSPHLRRKLDQINAEADRVSASSISEYLERVVIDCVPNPRRFGDVAEGWQRERNAVLTPIFEFVGGVRPDYKGPLHVWMGFSKGHDKTSTIARYLNWLAGYSKRALRVICAAKDREQSEIVRDVMDKESRLNKWLHDRLEFKRNVVEGKKNGTKIEFLTSDAGGAQGRTPDFIVMDELTNWDSSALFESLFSAVVKRAGHCGLAVLTNAGFLGSWQKELRDLAEKEHGRMWHFFEQKVGERLASWMTQEAINQASKFLTPSEARRLYRNEWIDPAEAGIKLFSPADVDACVGVPKEPPPGAQIFFGVDYGGTCDRTALAVLWYEVDTMTVHVLKVDCFQGNPENEVRIADVEKWLELHWGLYPNAVAVIDTLGQLLGTAQKFEDEGMEVRRVQYRGGRTNALMCQCLRSLLTNRRMVFAINCGLTGTETLADELKRVVSKPMVYGERIDHKAGQHDDKTVAVGQAAMQAIMETMPGAVPQKETPQTPEELFRRTTPKTSSIFERGHAARRGLFGLA